MNETYDNVDSQPRPVLYLNPCVIKDSCIDEENYETLTDVQTQFNNIYECLPAAGGDTLQPTQSEEQDLPLKKKDNAGPFDENEIKKIKRDLRKTKVSVIILASFVVVFLVVSLVAVALAVTIPLQNRAESQPKVNGPQAIVSPDNPSTQGMDDNTQQIKAQLRKLEETLNATIRRLSGEHSELADQTHRNYSNVLSKLEDLRNDFISHADKLHHMIQQTTNQSNATSLVNQVVILQNQSQQSQHKIMQVEGHIGDLMLGQNNLQKNLNATQNNLTLVRYQISNVQNQLSTAQSEVESVDNGVTELQGQLTTIQTNVTTLYTQMNSLRQQFTTAQTNVAMVSSQATSLQATLNNHLSSPIQLYSNCRQDTTSCSVSTLLNDERRLLCSTPSLSANITVGQQYVDLLAKPHIQPYSMLFDIEC